MATNTPRYQLKKPAGTDPFLTADFQTNYDKIDAAIPKGTLGYALIHFCRVDDVTANNVLHSWLARADVDRTQWCRRTPSLPSLCSTNEMGCHRWSECVCSIRRDGVDRPRVGHGPTKVGSQLRITASIRFLRVAASPSLTPRLPVNHRYEWYFRASVAVSGRPDRLSGTADDRSQMRSSGLPSG
jgi:hypothetical protein